MPEQTSLIQDLFEDQKEKSKFEVEFVTSPWLKKKLANGCRCPLCGQYAKIYPRTINAEMARVLVLLYRHFVKYPHSKPVHLDSFLSSVCGAKRPKGNNHSLLVHWKLLDRVGSRVSNAGKKRDGYYKTNKLTNLFCQGYCGVPKHVYLYNNSVIGFSEDSITIGEALRNKFDKEKLMSQEPFNTVEFV